MLSETINGILNSIPGLGSNSLTLARGIHKLVMGGGDTTRTVADLLHGTWLGHPLHPMLTDIVIGAWGLGAFYDILSIFNDSYEAEATADSLTRLGNYAAIPTILSGLTDYSTIPEHAAETGLSHALLNDIAFGLNLASVQARDEGDRDRAVALSMVAATLLMASGYLGAELAYEHRVGVNHADPSPDLLHWTPVAAVDRLVEREPTRVDVDGNPVLLYRRGRQIMAIGAVCPHAGGPLEEGHVHDHGDHGVSVHCPWHDSEFDMYDGSVIHGPSTYPVASYDTRVVDGQVEVRLSDNSARRQVAERSSGGRLTPYAQRDEPRRVYAESR